MLNYTEGCIDIYPVKKEEEKMFDADDFDCSLFLSEKGYDIDNCHYMIVDNDSDEIPVYWHGENIPCTNL